MEQIFVPPQNHSGGGGGHFPGSLLSPYGFQGGGQSPSPLCPLLSMIKCLVYDIGM